MAIVKTEGILLRAHPYSESSQILRFLTPDHGILPVVARGIRRESSKGRGGAGTFDQVELELSFRSHRDLQTLRGFAVSRSRHSLGRDMIRFWGASMVAEFLLVHAPHHGDAALYHGVVGALDALQEASEARLPAVVLSAGWTVLERAGLAPDMDQCTRCGGGLGDTRQILRFSTAEGGVLCSACGTGARGPGLGPGARQDLRALLAGSAPENLRGAGVHLQILNTFALHHLAPRRPFQAPGLLHPLLSARPTGRSTDPSEGVEG